MSGMRYIIEEKTQVVKDQANILNSANQDNFKSAIYEAANDVDENIVCDVCLSDEYDAADPDAPAGSSEFIGDQIVLCEKCNSGVHQNCYKRELVNPNGLSDSDWYCDRCTYLVK